MSDTEFVRDTTGRDRRSRSGDRNNQDKNYNNNTDKPRERGRSGSNGRDGGGDDPCLSLLVRNLSYNVKSDEIKELMSKYGEVRDVYIPPDFETGKPRGFCFCEFFTAKGARDALDNLNGYKLDGRELSIVFAIHKRKVPDQMRPRGRGGNDRGYNNRGGGYDRRDDNRGGYRRDDRDYDRRDDRGYYRGDRRDDRRGGSRDRDRSRDRGGRRDYDRRDDYDSRRGGRDERERRRSPSRSKSRSKSPPRARSNERKASPSPDRR